MAKNSFKENTTKSASKESSKFNIPKLKLNLAFLKDRRFHLVIGYLLLLFSFYFLIAFTSYFFTGKADQSVVQSISETGWKQSGTQVENWLGLLGAWVSNLFIYNWFGIASFILIPVCFLLGVRIVYKKELVKNSTSLFRILIFSLLWISITSGYLIHVSNGAAKVGFLCGGIGLETAILLDGFIGWGTLLLMGFFAILFIIYTFNVTSLDDVTTLTDEVKNNNEEIEVETSVIENSVETEEEEDLDLELKTIIQPKEIIADEVKIDDVLPLEIEEENIPLEPVKEELKEVESIPESSIFVPNIFTPNGDSENDKLSVKVKNVNSYTISIYCVNGRLVFTSENPEEQWDGRDQQGNVVEEGVYYYLINAIGDNNNVYAPKGYITVRR